MSTQDHVNKDPKLTEDKDATKNTTGQTNPESGKGDGYVPPAPDVPSARNTRDHSGPITSKEPRTRQD
ncbi:MULTISPECIES: hypothetical protein [Sphingobacterium]|uniref:Sigma-like protein n=1 Tax=Sphingobacterium populi TaxID=1812824 RepID=A0ABW5UIS1_9SPHI|nr:hypothetical protein [Sphingobacterium sp. CFCC 11742]